MVYKEVLKLVKNFSKVTYAMVGINYWLKVELKNGKWVFFTDIDSLNKIY